METQGHPHCVEVQGPPRQEAAGSSPKLEVQAAAGAGAQERVGGPSPRKQSLSDLPVLRA